MLPREERLTRGGEFREVCRMGRRYSGAGLVMYYLPGRAGTRVGFRVPRRVGSAVLRNQVRRRLREAVRQLRGQIPSGWYVVVARESCARMGLVELRETVRELARRAEWDAGR